MRLRQRWSNSLQNFVVSNFEQTDLTTENIILQWKWGAARIIETPG